MEEVRLASVTAILEVRISSPTGMGQNIWSRDDDLKTNIGTQVEQSFTTRA